MMKKPKIYEVHASETIFHYAKVEANSEEEAREDVMNGLVDTEIENSAGFEIDKIIEIK